MADLTQNTALVFDYSDNPVRPTVLVGEAVDIGMPIFYDTDTGYWMKAKNSGGVTQGGRDGLMISLSSAAASGQYITAFRGTNIGLGATLTIGQTYGLSSTAGKIAPITDLASGQYVTPLGVAVSGTNLYAMPGSMDAEKQSIGFASNIQKA